MRNIFLFTFILFASGFIQAQTFDFSCSEPIITNGEIHITASFTESDTGDKNGDGDVLDSGTVLTWYRTILTNNVELDITNRTLDREAYIVSNDINVEIVYYQGVEISVEVTSGEQANDDSIVYDDGLWYENDEIGFEEFLENENWNGGTFAQAKSLIDAYIAQLD